MQKAADNKKRMCKFEIYGMENRKKSKSSMQRDCDSCVGVECSPGELYTGNGGGEDYNGIADRRG